MKLTGKVISQSDNLVLELGVGDSRSFKLEEAVCNHGFFMMTPNVWIPTTETLQRPLRLKLPSSTTTTSLIVSISHHPHDNTALLVRVHATKHLSSPDCLAILVQVRRMLRISARDEKDVQEFQKLHPQANQRGFGRLFRSPSLFEDAVKSILLCNCTWTRTLDMAQALCDLQPELANSLIQDHEEDFIMKNGKKGVKRKRSSNTSNEANKDAAAALVGDFPNAKELASLNEEFLQKRCNLGYRACRILNLARSVESNRLKLHEFEDASSDMALSEKLYGKLKRVKGFGPFACANVLMCIGFYHRIPQDSETIRHLSDYHARKDCNKKTCGAIVEEIYGKYAPYQCLAYWLELLEYYEGKFGRLSKLDSSCYRIVTGSIDTNISKLPK